jgi:hypothetical protein
LVVDWSPAHLGAYPRGNAHYGLLVANEQRPARISETGTFSLALYEADARGLDEHLAYGGVSCVEDPNRGPVAVVWIDGLQWRFADEVESGRTKSGTVCKGSRRRRSSPWPPASTFLDLGAKGQFRSEHRATPLTTIYFSENIFIRRIIYLPPYILKEPSLKRSVLILKVVRYTSTARVNRTVGDYHLVVVAKLIAGPGYDEAAITQTLFRWDSALVLPRQPAQVVGEFSRLVRKEAQSWIGPPTEYV